MIVLGYDLETTGLDTQTDRIIEVGAVIWDTEKNVPIEIYSQFVKPDPSVLPLKEEIINLTGISDEYIEALGVDTITVMAHIQGMCTRHKVEYIIAHNGEGYDKPLTYAELSRCGIGGDFCLRILPWVDTRSDLPFKIEPSSRRLMHLAGEHGFLNPFSHRAVFDVLTMLKVMSHYDFNEVAAQSKIPWATARALVGYEDREKAKEMRFSWEKIGEKTYTKMWVKKIRENQVEKEQAAAEAKGFKIIRIE